MRKSPILIFILLFCFVFTLPAQTDLNASVPTDPNVRIGKLSNGLTYYIRKNAKPEHKAEMRLVVNAGSILEREDQRGLAHFMEHMNFNGTKNFPKNELVAYLQSIGVSFGGDLNAYTSFDETVYILPVPTEKKELIDKGLLVLADWAGGATLDAKEIDKERGVVLEELRLGLGAGQRMRDKYFPKVFAGSQYAERLPIGRKEILENFDRQTLLDFYETWYRPDLQAVVVVGDVDVDEIEAKIKAQFSGLKAKRKPEKRSKFSLPETRGTLIEIETDKETPTTNVQLLYKKPAFKTDTLTDLRGQLIRQFYGAMLSSRLDEIRQSANSPFTGAGGGFSSLFRNTGTFQLTGNTNPQNAKATIQTLFTENRRVREFGFTKTEFERIKQNYLTNLENAFRERDKTQSFIFAGNYVSNFLTREPATSIEFDYQFGKQIVPSITLEEINALAKRTTTENNGLIVVTGPAQTDAKYPTRAEILALLKESETAKLTPYAETVTNEPLIKDLPKGAKLIAERKDDKFGITYWTLSNGVKVVLKPTDFQADEIRMYGFSPGGMSLVETEKARSGLYFNQIIGESGVKNLSKIELNKTLAGKNASASIGISELFETVNGYSTPKDFETMLQLAFVKLTDTNLDKTVFDSVIAKQKILIPTLTANPQTYFGEQIFKITTQNHPRAFDLFDVQNIERARFEDVQAIYKDRFSDDSDFTFIFVGNFEPEKVKAQIVKYLGNLPSANRRESWKDWGIKPPDGRLEKNFQKGVDDKAAVRIIYAGATPYDKDENRNLSSLGELLTIKLTEVLREEKSGVYGVGASGRLIKIPSERYAFNIQFSCAPKNVESLIQATTDEIAKIQNGEIEENEINKVKEARLVKIEEAFKDNGYWLSAITGNLTEGRDILTLEESKTRINAVNKAELQRAAQKYLKSEQRMQFILLPESAAQAAGQMPKSN
jgi:zinc protease